jgi:hypothetical protein
MFSASVMTAARNVAAYLGGDWVSGIQNPADYPPAGS